MGFYPLFINLAKMRCLVVGGGQVATRKIRSLVRRGGRVTVVAPLVTEEVERLAQENKVSLVKRPFTLEDLDGHNIVFAATNDPTLNRFIAEEAEKRGLLVNVCSARDLGNCITPAFGETEEAIFAIATEGKDPLRAATLKIWLENLLTSENPRALPQRNAVFVSRATAMFPGGVNSPVRSFRAVGRQPLFIQKGKGSKVFDADGNAYIDCLMSWGALILGHAHPKVVRSLVDQACRGTSFGLNHPFEVLLGEKIQKHFSSIEVLRFVNSGTEAVMSALRLARAATGRKKILKFAGCYHGHVDVLLVASGSGGLTFGTPDSQGIPQEWTSDTIVVSYNDLETTQKAFELFGKELAAVIVEPVAGNMGVVLPHPAFLPLLREKTRECGALLIFDEVITGFRLSLSGYQGICGIQPDLTILGKVVGGGLPLGVYGGKKELMRLLAPEGAVYQAGTLAGNPIATCAGYATLTILEENPSIYRDLDKRTQKLTSELEDIFAFFRIPFVVNAIGSMFTPFFATRAVVDTESALSADAALYALFFQGMIDRGILPPPSPFESWFLSAAHTEEDCERICEAAWETAKAMAKQL
ncbi:MAG: glutamate-1-semialdehyde 2,1-aminomutase [Candidatus Caldatribacterium sp.]|uniref:glutamate-1-semialdehyde 2,1-aminomutase n=1 Tax=Candidatus Caldatribacterium sp. TaxID=2282143 RepID=UPI0029915BAE|nr:glutamate-1-semialdehyde 2,1-aminomutase [Candidatus Caldatribacterium sp.]MCX7730984.1 glutamate-1-semialdehyde 2,1-aminomutase [Candidatus Caldatribacterium sp.]MDW8080592.1 glutamate-1-semialdehyde 2,1-aminomutase [Candidatus Calescibacterium sp.]